jgi:hypothetical protein
MNESIDSTRELARKKLVPSVYYYSIHNICILYNPKYYITLSTIRHNDVIANPDNDVTVNPDCIPCTNRELPSRADWRRGKRKNPKEPRR